MFIREFFETNSQGHYEYNEKFKTYLDEKQEYIISATDIGKVMMNSSTTLKKEAEEIEMRELMPESELVNETNLPN